MRRSSRGMPRTATAARRCEVPTRASCCWRSRRTSPASSRGCSGWRRRWRGSRCGGTRRPALPGQARLHPAQGVQEGREGPPARGRLRLSGCAGRPLLGAAARRDPRASLAKDDAELLVAVVIDTLLSAERARPASQEFFAWRDLCGAFERGLADAGRRGAEYASADATLATALLDLFDRWLYALSLQPHRPDWVLLRLPHALDFQQLVPLKRPRADRPEIPRRTRGAPAPPRRLPPHRSADVRRARCAARSTTASTATSARRTPAPRDSRRRTRRRFKKNPLGIAARRAARSTSRSARCTPARRGRLARRAGPGHASTTRCAPGTGHRICNDCMKACIFQKQDPVNIPQIETRRAHRRARAAVGIRDLRAAHALESAQRSSGRIAAALRRQERAGRGPGPGRLHARALPAERRLRRGRHRRPEDRAASRRSSIGERRSSAFDDVCAESRSTSASPAGFGGVSEYGITVRWDKSFLDVLHLTLARGRSFRLYGGMRFGGTLTLEDAFERSASTTSRSRPARASRRSSA